MGKDPMAEDSDAGDALAAPPQVGDMAAKTVTVPADLLPDCKVGDTYTVKTMDGDNVTLEAAPSAAPEDEGGEWGDGLVNHVKEKGGL